MRDDTVLMTGVLHFNVSRFPDDLIKDLLVLCRIPRIIRFIEFKETEVFKRTPLDDIVSFRIDDGNLRLFKLFLRKDPFLFNLRYGNQPEQDGFSGSLRFLHRYPVAESDHLFRVQRIGIRPRQIDLRSHLTDPAELIKQVQSAVGDAEIFRVSDAVNT